MYYGIWVKLRADLRFIPESGLLPHGGSTDLAAFFLRAAPQRRRAAARIRGSVLRRLTGAGSESVAPL